MSFVVVRPPFVCLCPFSRELPGATGTSSTAQEALSSRRRVATSRCPFRCCGDILLAHQQWVQLLVRLHLRIGNSVLIFFFKATCITFNYHQEKLMRNWNTWYKHCYYKAGRPGFDFWQKLGFILLATESRPDLGPTQPPIECLRGSLSAGVMRPGREADHSPPSKAEVKNVWSYTSSHSCLHGMILEHKDFILPPASFLEFWTSNMVEASNVRTTGVEICTQVWSKLLNMHSLWFCILRYSSCSDVTNSWYIA